MGLDPGTVERAIEERSKTARKARAVPRENARTKGERYLVSGRLTVVFVDADRVEALCKGDSGHTYHVSHEHGIWSCTCPARGRCAHLVAAMRVLSRPGSAVLR
jgi:uncharacterized Zn finger protein